MSGRYAFGALWAYFKTNQGTMYGIDFWTAKLQDHIEDMRVHEVSRLCEAFRDNRQLHRDHMRDLLDNFFKNKVILAYWDGEVKHNQRCQFDLARELDNIEWYDEEVWTKMFDLAVNKKKINNIYDFMMIHKLMVKYNNAAPDTKYAHLNGKFSKQIERLIEKHYTTDREWKYDA